MIPIFCFKCGLQYTKQYKTFVFLACKEVLCFCCSGIEKNNIPSKLDTCPCCKKINVEIKKIDEKLDPVSINVLFGANKLVSVSNIKSVLNGEEFKLNQLNIIMKKINFKRRELKRILKVNEEKKKAICTVIMNIKGFQKELM